MNYANNKIPSLDSENLYYFLGLLCTDGHIQIIKKKSMYKLIIFTSNNDEKEMISHLMNELFNRKTSIREKNYGFSVRPNYEISIYSKDICNFLCGIGIPFGAKSLTIILPDIIKKAESRFFWNFIRGIFDGDGSIINTPKSYAFKIASGSEKFLDDLKNAFLERGFSPILRKERENLWVLRLNKKTEIDHIYHLIYSNAKYFYLRKKLNWEKGNI